MSTVSILPVPPADAGPAPSGSATVRLPNWLGILTFALQHLGCLAVLWTGTTPVALALCAVCYAVRMFGITAGYHRYFAHRSYKTSRAFQFVLAFLGCSALQKGPLWWVAHHRRHHRYSDTPEDPHSPLAHGVWWSHVGWILAPDYAETNWQEVRDLSRYPELRWLDRNHWLPPLAVAGLCLLLGGWSGLVWGFLISTVLSYHATFAVNSLCHLFGRRRYVTPDASRNNLLVALLTFGEGWHNNHHHYQSSANQGFRWWEIDVSYYLIRFLGVIGLVWDIRKPPRHQLLTGHPPGQAEEQPSQGGHDWRRQGGSRGPLTSPDPAGQPSR
jgi:stearoyl-CoA desaturase (delta-9 desaturase)